jgi:DNA-binding transcriptional LysR family regulator
MRREELGDLTAFLAVAEERSFTRAAARLGTSQSALSYTVRRLEARLGMRLLTRTTRSVAPTQAGERLLGALGPAIGDIEAVVGALSEFRDKPAGSFRITAGQHAIDTVLWPVLSRLLKDYPDIKVELNAESALTDIVAERFDAGVRLGEQVEKDMIAVRIAPDAHMIVVAAPSCFEIRARPATPRDLTRYPCRPMVASTLGNSQRTAMRSGFASTDSSLSTAFPKSWRRRWTATAWLSCRRTSAPSRSPTGGSSSCLRIGARGFPATISIIQAVASPARHLR